MISEKHEIEIPAVEWRKRVTKEVGRGGVAREEEDRSTEKGCRRGLLGVSLTLKG